MLPVLLGTVVALLVWMGLDWMLKQEDFEKIPGPRGIYLADNALDFLMDPVKLFYHMRSLANKYKQIFKVKMGMKKVVIIHNPEDVEVVMSGTKYNKKGYLYKFLEPWLKEGLLLSDGPKWLHRRKILTPTFHFNILRHFQTHLEENSQKLVEQLRAEVGKDKTDVSGFITDFTLSSICETAMGIKLDPEGSDFGRRYKNGIHTLGQILVYRSQRIWMYPDWLFPLTSVGRKQNKLLNLLSSFRDSVINKRRETCEFENISYDTENNEDIIYTGKKRLAMLDLLLQAEKEGVIDAAGIGEEVDTFMFEGHDTTSTALQFALMSLANCQEAQDKVVEECDRIFGSSDRAATMSDLGQMKYLDACIKESLRLYPPVHFVMRKINNTMKLKNHTVPAGTDCAILVYDLQRRDDQFVEPLEFKPERFLKEPTWHPFSYVPFSAGPRNCIGQKFAMMEMKLALSSVLRKYRLIPVTRAQDIIFITDFILRPSHPIYIKFEERIYLANKYKNIYKCKIGSTGHVILFHPEDIEAVISGVKNSRKGFIYRFIKPWLQDGLLLSAGTKWQQRRKILTYAFHFKILQQFSTVMYENTVKLTEKLQVETRQMKTDIMYFINNYTLTNITETAMGTKLDDEEADFAAQYKSGIHTLGGLIVYRAQRTWLWLDTFYRMTEAGKQQEKVLQLLTSFRDSVIDKRRRNGHYKNLVLDDESDDYNYTFESGKKRMAMLDLLLQAEKEGIIDAKGIGEEVDTFMFEGHDTTAVALQYTLMLLANHQEVQDKAAADCEQVLGSSEQQPTMAQLNQMKYLECCIKESLRLYPPVSFFSRYIDEETKLKNYTLPAGTDVIILAYDLHRRDDQFVEPLEFRPERFQTEPTWHPYSYIPFSAGPRNCIGQKFAIMQMKLVLSAILLRYKLLPVTKPRDFFSFSTSYSELAILST